MVSNFLETFDVDIEDKPVETSVGKKACSMRRRRLVVSPVCLVSRPRAQAVYLPINDKQRDVADPVATIRCAAYV